MDVKGQAKKVGDEFPRRAAPGFRVSPKALGRMNSANTTARMISFLNWQSLPSCRGTIKFESMLDNGGGIAYIVQHPKSFGFLSAEVK